MIHTKSNLQFVGGRRERRMRIRKEGGREKRRKKKGKKEREREPVSCHLDFG